MTPTPCPHPPERLYSWWAYDQDGKDVLVVACCECGKVLKGVAAEAWEGPERAAKTAIKETR